MATRIKTKLMFVSMLLLGGCAEQVTPSSDEDDSNEEESREPADDEADDDSPAGKVDGGTSKSDGGKDAAAGQKDAGQADAGGDDGDDEPADEACADQSYEKVGAPFFETNCVFCHGAAADYSKKKDVKLDTLMGVQAVKARIQVYAVEMKKCPPGGLDDADVETLEAYLKCLPK